MIIYKKAKSRADLEEMYRLRFRVACRERLLEPEESYPSGCIRDAFDEHSIHIIARHFDLTPVGALRLVHGSPIGLPIQKKCGIDVKDPEQSGELSQLAISRPALAVSGAMQREVLVGLLRALCLEGARVGIKYWYMVLTKSMHRMFSGCGFGFLPVQATCSCRDCIPYMINLSNLERLLFLQHVPEAPLHSGVPKPRCPSRRTKLPHSSIISF